MAVVPAVTGQPHAQTSSLALPQMLVAESSGLVTPVQAAPSLCSVARSPAIQASFVAASQMP